MKVLLYSPVFWPSLGGVETITKVLGEELIRAGIDVTVMTETTSPEVREFPFHVVRSPSMVERMRWACWADIIHSNSASVAMWPYAELAQRPFIWTHNGYQVLCLDGLGWLQGAPAPIKPRASFRHFWRASGPFQALKGGAKLIFRRFVALQGVYLNIPATRWVGYRLALPRSLQAYTPYAVRPYTGNMASETPEYNYVFIGRLVSEKGVDVLIQAFHKVVSHSDHEKDRLLVVGDGPVLQELKKLAGALGVADRVEFRGSLRGEALHTAMMQAEIAVVPSTWEEPMGGVTLELMAAGRALIVSRRGGHAEVAGEAALTFENGDATSLAEQMLRLANDETLRQTLRKEAVERLKHFTEEKLTRRYLTIYKAVADSWYS